MQIRTQYWIPTVIFLISFFFYLSLISKGPVTVDCLNLVIKSRATIETGHLQYLFGSGYPLMVLLGSIFISISKCFGFPDPVLAVNFIGVVFGSLSIFAFYLLIQKIYNNTLTSILTSFMLLLNPLFLDVSTYGINHAPALCFLLLGLLSLLRFQASGNFVSLMISALYLGLMGATRLQDLILTFPAVGSLYFLDLGANPARYGKHKAAFFFLFITAIVLIVMSFHLPYFTFDHANYDVQAKNFWAIGLSENFQGLFSKPLIRSLSFFIQAFSVAGIVCFGAGLYYISKFNKRLLIFITLWLAFPLGFYGNIMTSTPRFFNIMLPALILPISVFLTYVLEYKKIAWNLIAGITFLLITLVPLQDTCHTFLRRHHYALIPDYYRWVGRSTQPDAVIISSDDDLFIAYYSKRRTLPRPVAFKHLSAKELNDFKNKLDGIIKNHKPVYITNSAFVLYDHYAEFRDLLRQNYRLVQIGQMPLELWYHTPFNPQLHISALVKVERKN